MVRCVIDTKKLEFTLFLSDRQNQYVDHLVVSKNEQGDTLSEIEQKMEKK